MIPELNFFAFRESEIHIYRRDPYWLRRQYGLTITRGVFELCLLQQVRLIYYYCFQTQIQLSNTNEVMTGLLLGQSYRINMIIEKFFK